MATGVRLEDRLDGAGNFVSWKARIVLILEENELWNEVVNNTDSSNSSSVEFLGLEEFLTYVVNFNA